MPALTMPAATDIIPIVLIVFVGIVAYMGGIPDEEDMTIEPAKSNYRLTFHLSNTLNAFLGTIFVVIAVMQSDGNWIIVCCGFTVVSATLSFGLVSGNSHEEWKGEVLNRMAFAAIHVPLFIRYRELYHWIVFGIVVGVAVALVAVGAILDYREGNVRDQQNHPLIPINTTIGQCHYMSLLLMEVIYDILFYFIVLQPIWVELQMSVLLKVEVTFLILCVAGARLNRWARFRISWLYHMPYFQEDEQVLKLCSLCGLTQSFWRPLVTPFLEEFWQPLVKKHVAIIRCCCPNAEPGEVADAFLGEGAQEPGEGQA